MYLIMPSYAEPYKQEIKHIIKNEKEKVISSSKQTDDLKNDIQKLNDQIINLNKEKITSNHELGALLEKMKTKESDIVSLGNKIMEVQNERDDQFNLVNHLKSKLQESNEREATLKAENDIKLSNLNIKISELEDKLKSSNQNIESLSSHCNEIKNDLKQKLKDLEDKSKNIDEYNKQIKLLKDQVSDLAQQKNLLTRERDDLNNERQIVESNLIYKEKQFKNVILGLENSLNSKKIELEKALGTVAVQESNINHYKDLIDEYKASLEQIRLQKDQTYSEIEKSKQSIKNAEDNKISLEKIVQGLRKREQDQNNIIKDHTKKISELEAALLTSSGSHEDLIGSVQSSMEKRIQEKQEKIVKLQQNIQNLNDNMIKSVNEKDNKIASLEQQMNANKIEM